jgi:type IV pilus assembly protein PilE
MKSAMKKNGFTLVELMITVAVVAILAMIAIPNYTQYVRKGNRTDATKTLTLDAQALERCYSQSFSYAACPGAAVGGPVASLDGKYNIIIAVPDAVTPGAPPASYYIKAVPVGTQVGDTDCAQFSLNTTNLQLAQNSGGTDNSKVCWGST